VSLPFAWYFIFSLPFEDVSETDSAFDDFVGGGRDPEETSDGRVASRGLLPFPPSCVELLRDVVWLLLLDTVKERVMPLLGLLGFGDGRHSANPSRLSCVASGTFPFTAIFFSFFSTSFCCTLRLRAPRADMSS